MIDTQQRNYEPYETYPGPRNVSICGAKYLQITIIATEACFYASIVEKTFDASFLYAFQQSKH